MSVFLLLYSVEHRNDTGNCRPLNSDPHLTIKLVYCASKKCIALTNN